jgi:hypothetical protein
VELINKKTVGTLFLILCMSHVNAEWSSTPEEIIVGAWGEGDQEFGINHQDTSDDLPGGFDVSESGNIVMADEVNGRFKIYDADRALTALIIPLVDRPSRWTISPVFVGENISLILNKFYFYNSSGKLINQVDSPNKARDDIDIEGILYIRQAKPINKWMTYSNTGELLNTYNEKPLVLGRIFHDLLIYNQEKHYRTEVIFDDATFSTMDPAVQYPPRDHFERDQGGHLYSIESDRDPRSVTRYNQCGKIAAKLTLPTDDITEIPPDMPGVEGQWIYNSQYYNPKIDIHGNVYATRRTPDNYSLVKWTWQDSANDKNEGPDAPINLTATEVTVNGVKVEWEGSLQDPGCVTGYQLLRSDSEVGTYTVVTEIFKGNQSGKDTSVEAGKTYYYQIKALSTVSDSDPSNTIMVTIPDA